VQQPNQCRSNLGFHHVGRGEDDALDLEVLLQDFEEWVNLSALLVDGGNCIDAQPVVVGEKHQNSADILAQRFDAVQQMRTRLQGSHADELDGLILEGVAGLGWISLLEHVTLGMLFHARDEESLKIGSFGEQARVIVVPNIDHDDAKTAKLVLVGEPNLQRSCAL
jgi:hypothetical protein